MLMLETDIPTIHKYVLSANDLLTVSNQGLVFIAQDRVMRRLEGRLDKKMPEYSASLYKYKLTMSIVKRLYSEGILTEKEYAQIDTIMVKKYGLSLDSIFRESLPESLDNMFF